MFFVPFAFPDFLTGMKNKPLEDAPRVILFLYTVYVYLSLKNMIHLYDIIIEVFKFYYHKMCY